MMWLHLVARSYPGLRPLRGFARCRWLWRALRGYFPEATDAVLMPNGVHLVVPADGFEDARGRLIYALRGFGRRYGHGQRLFEPVPVPTVLPDGLHRWRTSRYVPLNPCRANLVRDPLEWLWSTYRDVLGAAVDPWVTADALARAHERPRRGFEAAFHHYVSSDPTVAVLGTPLPVAAPSVDCARFPLERIALASAAAYRTAPAEVFRHCQPRRVFVALARDQGWPNDVIANNCGLGVRQVRRVDVAPQTLGAARICLADDRLLRAVSGDFLPDVDQFRVLSATAPQNGHDTGISLH